MFRNFILFLSCASFFVLFGCKISGTVTDGDGYGLRDVTISFSNGDSELTDVNGNYISQDIPPQQYTVTPSKEGYIFTPENQTVTLADFLSGETAHVDFLATIEGNCADGLDNDADGWIDELDPDCMLAGGEESGFGFTQCNDGTDNDRDGSIDSEDLECSSAFDNNERT